MVVQARASAISARPLGWMRGKVVVARTYRAERYVERLSLDSAKVHLTDRCLVFPIRASCHASSMVINDEGENWKGQLEVVVSKLSSVAIQH